MKSAVEADLGIPVKMNVERENPRMVFGLLLALFHVAAFPKT